MSCTYLAHPELESVVIIIIIKLQHGTGRSTWYRQYGTCGITSAHLLSRASEADAGPSGHGRQLEVTHSGFICACLLPMLAKQRTVLPGAYASKALLALFGQHALVDPFTNCELPCSQEPWHTCYQTSAFKENVFSDP